MGGFSFGSPQTIVLACSGPELLQSWGLTQPGLTCNVSFMAPNGCCVEQGNAELASRYTITNQPYSKFVSLISVTHDSSVPLYILNHVKCTVQRWFNVGAINC